MLDQLYIVVLILSLLAGISVYFTMTAPLYLKLFPVFLLVTGVVQIIGSWLASQGRSNIILYNFYTVFEFWFFLFVLREVITNRFMKKSALLLIAVYTFIAFFNMFFIQNPSSWNSISYSLGSLLVVALCIFYFFELFKLPKATRLSRDPGFWICSGLLFFHTCSFPFLALANFLDNIPSVFIRNLSTILTLLNILMYVLFIVAFLCRIKVRKPL